MPLVNCTEPVDKLATDLSEGTRKPLGVVCLGRLTPHRVATVEKYPEANGGTVISSLFDLDASDAVIASVALDKLGCAARFC